MSRNQTWLLEDLLAQAARTEVTYTESGWTRAEQLPVGYRHDRFAVTIGRGEQTWLRARQAVRLWQAHHHAGITITPSDAPLERGGTVLASRSVGPILIIAPCRIVYTTSTPTRYGFAYGTLPGHPEQGEEAFHVQIDQYGQVTAEVVVFSRPADLPTRLAGPIARFIQKATTKRYLEGIRAYALVR